MKTPKIKPFTLIFHLLIATLLLSSCTDEQSSPLLPSKDLEQIKLPKIPFANITSKLGITATHESGEKGERYIPATLGGGIAFFDYNNDGFSDLLSVSGKPFTGNPSQSTITLLENIDGKRFQDVTSKTQLNTNTHYNTGIAIGDVNGDGWLDIFVAGLRENSLYINEKGKAFTDQTQQLGLSSSEMSMDAAFFDADQDGDLDLFVGNYVKWSPEIDQSYDDNLSALDKAYSHPNSFDATSSKLFINEYPSKFKDVSDQSGIAKKANGNAIQGKALAIQPIYINNDRLIDIFVANDNWKNFAFINQGNGKFIEQAEGLGLAYGFSGGVTAAMGVDFGWLGTQNKLHIATGNFSADMTSIYRKEHEKFFGDVSPLIGIGAATRNSLTWGVAFADFDLDGREDFLQVNGHVQIDINKIQSSQHYRQAPQLFWHCGSDCNKQFQALSDENIKDLATPLPARSMALADIDNDGDLDVAIGSIDSPIQIYRNDQNTHNNWIKIALRGSKVNPFAYGAVVEIHNDEIHLKQDLLPVTSYLSHSDLTLTFGLGQNSKPVTITVTWPDGSRSIHKNASTNQTLYIEKK